MKQWFTRLFCGVLLVSLAGCSSSNQLSFSVDCGDRACWRGIVPGETTQDDTIQRLAEVYGAENVSFPLSGLVEWSTSNVDSSSGGLVQFQQGVTSGVTVDFPADTVTVRQIIDQIGTPTYIQIVDDYRSDGLQCIAATLVYADQGIVMHLYRDLDLDHLVIGPSSYVSKIDILPQGADFTGTHTEIFAWVGYGDYCEP